MSEKACVEEWLAIRKEEGLKIDPDTAEVNWHYAQTLDPYGVDPKSTGGMPADWTGILRPIPRKRHMGPLS
jgi:hypothetical protein